VGELSVLLWEPACRRIIVRQLRGQGPLPQKSRCEPLWSPVWATSNAAFVGALCGRTIGAVVGAGLPANNRATASRARPAPTEKHVCASVEQRCYSLVPIGAVVGAGLPANNRATASRARSAPTEKQVCASVEQRLLTGANRCCGGSRPAGE
jgi:hypothetical protein